MRTYIAVPAVETNYTLSAKTHQSLINLIDTTGGSYNLIRVELHQYRRGYKLHVIGAYAQPLLKFFR